MSRCKGFPIEVDTECRSTKCKTEHTDSRTLPLCQSGCGVPASLSQSCPCRWFWVAGSCRCEDARLRGKRWSCGSELPVSDSTRLSPCPSGWQRVKHATEEAKQKTVQSQNCYIAILISPAWNWAGSEVLEYPLWLDYELYFALVKHENIRHLKSTFHSV